jgi:hypothetical protein
MFRATGEPTGRPVSAAIWNLGTFQTATWKVFSLGS